MHTVSRLTEWSTISHWQDLPRRVSLPSSVGIVPVKYDPDKFRFVIAVNIPSSLGIGPPMLVWINAKVPIFVNAPSVVGIVPEKPRPSNDNASVRKVGIQIEC